jgi:hypothetical protein
MSRVEITVSLDLGDDEAGAALTEILGVLAAGHVSAKTQRAAEGFGELHRLLTLNNDAVEGAQRVRKGPGHADGQKG